MEYQLSGIMKQEENFANLSSNASHSTMLSDCYTYQINLGQKNQQPQPHLDDDNKVTTKKCFGNQELQIQTDPVGQHHIYANFGTKSGMIDGCVEDADEHDECMDNKMGPTKRGSLQLWQFLLHLLESKDNENMIEWTRKSAAEFKLHEPEKVACRWGIQKNRPTMNYDKLSRSLRYYYEKGIMQKVSGERYVYRFINHDEVNKYLSASKGLFKFGGEFKQQPSDAAFFDAYAQGMTEKKPKGLKRLGRPAGYKVKSLKKLVSAGNDNFMRYSPYSKPLANPSNGGQLQAGSLQEPTSLDYNQLQVLKQQPGMISAGCYYNNFNLSVNPNVETSFKPLKSDKKEHGASLCGMTSYNYSAQDKSINLGDKYAPYVQTGCDATNSSLGQSSYASQSLNSSSSPVLSGSSNCQSSSVLDASPKNYQGSYYSNSSASNTTPSTPSLFNQTKGSSFSDYSMIHSYQGYNQGHSDSYSEPNGLNQSTAQSNLHREGYMVPENSYKSQYNAYASSPYYSMKPSHQHELQQHQLSPVAFSAQIKAENQSGYQFSSPYTQENYKQYKLSHQAYANQPTSYVHQHQPSGHYYSQQQLLNCYNGNGSKPSNDPAAVGIKVAPHSPPASISTLNLSSVSSSSSSSSSSCYNTNESELNASSNFY